MADMQPTITMGGAGGGSSYLAGFPGCDETYLESHQQGIVFEQGELKIGNHVGDGILVIERFADYDDKMAMRLNSDIYKNIFPEAVMDFGFVTEKMKDAITSYDDIRQENHGFSVGDVVYRNSDGMYGKALADGTERSTVVGIVSKVTGPNVFTLQNKGTFPYEHLRYKDTTILYLSDRVPGKLGHYLDMYDRIYVPVAIYADDKIILNIMDGVSGTLLHPYDDAKAEFEPYTPEELNDTIKAVWDNA